MKSKGSNPNSNKIQGEWGINGTLDKNMNLNLTNKRDFPDISIVSDMKKVKKARDMNDKQGVSIAEIKGLIRNPKQFIWIYGVELGYHLPPKAYITWPFIIAVLTGKIKLLKSKTISLTIQVPRLDQLSMRKVWPKVKGMKTLLSYMPMSCVDKYPPRKFFFEILHTRFRYKFDTLLKEAKEERQEEMLKNKLIVKVDPSMIQELKNCSIWNDISSSQISKRVCTTRTFRNRR